MLHSPFFFGCLVAVLLSLQKISKSFGARTLFENISFGIQDGERMGLIGANGSGKSTLLKILAGEEKADAGRLSRRQGARLGYLPQLDPFGALTKRQPELSVEQFMHQALEGHFEPGERDLQAAATLSRLDFENFAQRVATLSGGWRKRLALAAELAKKPDLLLLDEPTNHLDVEGILWLEQFLEQADFAFLLVSHDRYFLENACRRVMELGRQYPEGFFSVPGNYSQFLLKRQEFLDAQAQQEESLANKVRREVEWLRRGPKARGTKQQARIQQAGQGMEDLAELKQRNSQAGAIQVDFSASGRQTKRLLKAEGLAKSLGEKPLFKDLDLLFTPGTKLGLLGANGSGKSSLLKVLAGQLEPDAGQITRADGLRSVLFDQHRQQINYESSLRRALVPHGDYVHYQGRPMHVAAWAKRFLFRPEQLEMPVCNLSGGEQSRILIANLMLQEADLLMLDEPTNDLDIPSLEVLEDSLVDFQGALLLITHDRAMLERVCNVLLYLDGKGSHGFYMDLAQWEARNNKGDRTQEAGDGSKEKGPGNERKGQVAGKKKRLSYHEQREWEQMEVKIVEAEERLHALQKEMEDPVLFSDPAKLREKTSALGQAQQVVETLYARWQELEEKQGIHGA